MLEQLGEAKAAEDIENAIKKAVKNDIKNLGAGKMGYGTDEVGDLIVSYL
jgi:3-isopropylmalate dehydrogenase